MNPFSLLLLSSLMLTLASDDSQIKQVVLEVFRATHSGYSSDEVVLDHDLNRRFIDQCKLQLPDREAVEFNWTLINMRKAGKLSGVKTTVRRNSKTNSYQTLAEIVARSLIDQTQSSIDRIMADPELAEQFDSAAKKLVPDANLYLVRKAAFKLRKTRRLKPELITRIADWNRQINTFSAEQLRSDWELAPAAPGVYIFHDESGYLYIGQSENLQDRLKSHLSESSNFALKDYFLKNDVKNVRIEIHAFPIESRMSEVVIRRAYESELIRSRKPKFNILP